jgi:hypothetical protein
MTPQLEYTRRCRVAGCTAHFTSSPLVPIIGQTDTRVVKMIAQMSEHLATKHPDKWEQGAHAAVDYVNFLILRTFDLQDPVLQSLYESMRASLHRFTTRVTIPDSVIDGKIADLGFEAEDAEGLRLLLRDMRDLLTEQGSYAPPNGQPAPQPFVTP